MKHWKLKAVLATLLVFALYVVFQHPNLNPLYPESAFMYCVLITVLVAIFTLDRIGRVVAQPGPVQGVPGSVRFERFQNGSRWPLILVAVLWGAYFIVWAGSSVLFQVNAFRDQMPELVQMDFAEDFDTTDTSQLPIVDKAMAQKLADKKLGERPSLGSQVVLGEPTPAAGERKAGLGGTHLPFRCIQMAYQSGRHSRLCGGIRHQSSGRAVCGRLHHQIPAGRLSVAEPDVLCPLHGRALHRPDRLQL